MTRGVRGRTAAPFAAAVFAAGFGDVLAAGGAAGAVFVFRVFRAAEDFRVLPAVDRGVVVRAERAAGARFALGRRLRTGRVRRAALAADDFRRDGRADFFVLLVAAARRARAAGRLLARAMVVSFPPPLTAVP